MITAATDGENNIGAVRLKQFGKSPASGMAKSLSGITVTLARWKLRRGTMARLGLSKSNSTMRKEIYP